MTEGVKSPSKPRRSLRWLLSTWFLVILAATVVSLGGLTYVMAGRYLQRAGQLRLQTMATAALTRLSETEETEQGDDPRHLLSVPGDFEAQAQKTVDTIGSRFVLARLVRPDGTVLATSANTTPRAPRVGEKELAEVRARFAEKQKAPDAIRRQVVTYYDASLPHRWQVMLVPLHRGRELVAVLQVAQPSRDQEQALATLGAYLVVGGLVATALGLAAAFWLSRRIARPLERLEEATRMVAAGDLTARAGLGGGDHEVYAVAEAFDHMVDRLEESFEAQRRFVADASHELKTPLTAIGGMAEMLRMGATDGAPEKREKALRTIENEVDKMAELVSDLLMLSRAEQADTASEHERVLVSQLVDDAAAYAQVAGRDHAFTVETAPDLSIRGSRQPLSRVVRNLLENAFKYTPPAGTVTLRARRDADRVLLEVADSGVGISAQDLPHVFDRFYRADASRSRRTGGTGLGLSIVRAIVERHGGEVTLQSEPARGTTVRVSLPSA